MMDDSMLLSTVFLRMRPQSIVNSYHDNDHCNMGPLSLNKTKNIFINADNLQL